MCGMLIFTGHAAWHAPHSDEAWGRCGFSADAVVQRRQDAADRPGVDAAVGVPADAAVHRAGVEARPAADALQRFAERRRQHARAAVVEQDQVKLLRPVALAGAARTGDDQQYFAAKPRFITYC